MKIGLLFGSFNPVHSGHLMIAEFFAHFTHLEKIWFVVSPQNPLKKRETLWDAKTRLELVAESIRDNPKFELCDVEFSMKTPSYTYDTLLKLKESYPENEYTLIMGTDAIADIEKWKNYEKILTEFPINVYLRKGKIKPKLLKKYPLIKVFKTPKIGISSTLIRTYLGYGKSVRYLVPEPIYQKVQALQRKRPQTKADNEQKDI
jgi:nicotinate-nucleotide adenylyltransferase